MNRLLPEPYPATVKSLTAEQFLDVLQPRGLLWRQRDIYELDWVLRGQADADWRLVPAALRHNQTWFDSFKQQIRPRIERLVTESTATITSSREIPDFKRCCDVLIQMAAEVHAVDDFIRLADKVGHQLPDDSAFRVGAFGYSFDDVKNAWLNYLKDPKEGLRSHPGFIEYSVAQHHQIPTRALDWTYSPFVAAFFAAEEAFLELVRPRSDKPHTATHLAVYAIDYHIIPREEAFEAQFDLRLLTRRKSKIAYLGAQSGLFMYDVFANDFYMNNGYWRSFEEITSFIPSGKLHLHKVTLPVSEAGALLGLLAVEGYTRAHLMPNLDTVKQTLELHQLLEEYFGK